VYIDHLVQIRMSTWHRGRIVLAGDAGWCVTPMGGGGASLALTSGYVLAAYLASHDDDAVEAALVDYGQWMRPLVDDVQKLPRGLKYFAYPQTRFGLRVRGLLDRALTSPLLKPLTAKFTQVAHTDQELPTILLDERPARS